MLENEMVYAVTQGKQGYDKDYHIVAIFSTREKAKEFYDGMTEIAHRGRYHEQLYIEGWPVDNPLKPKSAFYYMVGMEGERTYLLNKDNIYTVDEKTLKNLNVVSYDKFTNSHTVTVSVDWEGFDEAVKIAVPLIDEYKSKTLSN